MYPLYIWNNCGFRVILCWRSFYTDIRFMKKTKSVSIFFLITGIYLLLLTFLLLTQPRSGYTPTTGEVLLNCLLLLPIWAVNAGIFFLDKKFIGKEWAKIAFGPNVIYWTLVGSILIGLIFNLDYHMRSGCFIVDEERFSPVTLILAGISILLLTIGHFTFGKAIGIAILIIEFIFWTLRALYFNGSLDLIVIGYFTMFCWTLRILFISKAISLRQNSRTNART